MSTPVSQPSIELVPPAAVADSSPEETYDPIAAQQQALATQVAALMARGKNGAHWFYWVAALSLVTSGIILAGGQTHFVIGLGVTLATSHIAAGMAQQMPEAALIVQITAFVFSLAVAAFVAMFGWLSAKRYTAAMGAGMALYFLDGTLYLLIQDWLSIGFHVFALFCMWNGLTAFRELNALEHRLAEPVEPAMPGESA